MMTAIETRREGDTVVAVASATGRRVCVRWDGRGSEVANHRAAACALIVAQRWGSCDDWLQADGRDGGFVFVMVLAAWVFRPGSMAGVADAWPMGEC